MLKILVVDDEVPVREWFTFCIEKSQKDYAVVGKASNGKEAMELFNKFHPDVIIADIKMPVMDGLELLKQVKKLDPDVAVIILTCYAEFEYAREALRSGAEEYILKTEVKDEDVIKLLENIEKKKVQRKYSQEGLISKTAICKAREKVVEEILSSKESGNTQYLYNRLEEVGIFLNEGDLFSLALDSSTEHDVLHLEEELASNFDKARIYGIKYKDSILLFVGEIRNIFSQHEKMIYLQEIAAYLLKVSQNGFIGISTIYNDKSYIKKIIEESIIALNQKFFRSISNVVIYSQVQESPEKCEALEDLVGKIYSTLNDLEYSRIPELINNMFDIFERENIRNPYYLQEICNEVFAILTAHLKLKYEKNISYEQIKVDLTNFESYDQLKEYVKDVTEGIMDILYEFDSKSKYSSPVQKAISYIEQNYDKDIKLTEIANYVYLNPNYLSRIFKEETGENISTYIVKLRLKKAEEFIKNKNMKIYEIAEKVGYPNVSYFSKVYKKYKGSSPVKTRLSTKSKKEQKKLT